MQAERVMAVVEAALLAADKPLSLDQLQKLFATQEENEPPSKPEIHSALNAIAEACESPQRGVELKQVASGWRFQVKQTVMPVLSGMWEEKPQRYSRALLETLALIAYRQPITRGDIEQVRGVAVSSHIIKTLLERDWIQVVGHREVPGRPALYATTKTFLDYFNLKSLDELPSLKELADLDTINPSLQLGDVDQPADERDEGGEGDSLEPEGETNAALADAEGKADSGSEQPEPERKER